MQITLDLPEELLQYFDQDHLSREILEALAVQAYQTEKKLLVLKLVVFWVSPRAGQWIAF